MNLFNKLFNTKEHQVTIWRTLTIAVIAVIGGIIGGYLDTFDAPTNRMAENRPLKETAYDRVMRTQTIRCGYAMWPSLLEKDPNTGKLSGIAYDYVEALGAALDLKIEWTEEDGWGDFPAALETGRIDAFCTMAWPTATRARQVDFVRPILYQPIYAYARKDDHRFDNHLTGINDPTVTIVGMDGEMSSIIAKSDYTKAKLTQIPQLSDSAELLLNVISGKADVTFTDPTTIAKFEKHNPGKIQRIISNIPVRSFGDSIAIGKGQEELRRMLDITTDEMLSSGKIESIILAYEKTPDELLRIAIPFQTTVASR